MRVGQADLRQERRDKGGKILQHLAVGHPIHIRPAEISDSWALRSTRTYQQVSELPLIRHRIIQVRWFK